jgi:hypothetical protein
MELGFAIRSFYFLFMLLSPDFPVVSIFVFFIVSTGRRARRCTSQVWVFASCTREHGDTGNTELIEIPRDERERPADQAFEEAKEQHGGNEYMREKRYPPTL